MLGLGFEHYASGYSGYLKAPLAIYRTPSVTVQDNTFAWNAMAGLNMAAPDGIVRGNTAAFNGELARACGGRTGRCSKGTCSLIIIRNILTLAGKRAG